MTQALDQARMDAFAGRVDDIMNAAGAGFLLSVGHRTGLFDTMAEMTEATSEQIANRAGLHERYVREWLNGATVARLVDHEPSQGTYRLPPEHAALLTRAQAEDNLASQTQFLAMVGLVEDDLVASFRDGGGVPYARFPAFQALMAEGSAAAYDAELIDVVLPLAPGLVERLHEGIDVADVGCGRGHAINLMAAAFPNSHFIGLDLSEEGITFGREEAAALGLSNATFAVQDIADLMGSFDLVTGLDIVHDQAQPRKVLEAIRNSLRPGGVFLCADIAASSDVHENLDHPYGTWLYTLSLFHCMTVSLAEGGEGLGTMWGEQLALEYFTHAGFRVDDPCHLEGNDFDVYYICHRD